MAKGPRYMLLTDPHFGHKEEKIVAWTNRPKDHEKRLMDGLCQDIIPTDVFICLGDISFNDDDKWSRWMTENVAARKKWLLIGNHDKHSISWYLDRGWDFAGMSLVLSLYGHRILLSHTPKPLLDAEPTLCVHGHFHNSDWRTKDPERAAIVGSRHILLAPELTHYRPVSLETLIKAWEKRKGQSVDDPGILEYVC